MLVGGFQYVYDVVLLIMRKYYQTISVLMELVLAKFSTWSRENGLGVNPPNNYLAHFVLADVEGLPRLKIATLDFSTYTKNQCEHWKINTEYVMKNTIFALYTCRRKCGFQLYNIH